MNALRNWETGARLKLDNDGSTIENSRQNHLSNHATPAARPFTSLTNAEHYVMAAGDNVIALLYVEDPVHKRQTNRSPWPGVKLTMDGPDRPSAVATNVRAPIIGYEVVEQREKFTVYKIQVSSNGKSWFVFRRYTDFDRLNAKLQEVFPDFRIKLPGRRWFRNNFDGDFLRERARGLQFYVNNIMYHPDIWQSPEVKQFFCLDDPPGPYDSLEESRAYCQHLEEQLNDARQTIQELFGELNVTKSQLKQARVQQEALVSALRAERRMHERKDSGHHVGGGVDVKELLAAGETSWKYHGASLTGKAAHLLQLASSHEVRESWQGKLEFAAQSSGLDRRRPSRGTRSSSDVATPRTSTPKAGDEGEESASASHPHQLSNSSVCPVETPGEPTSKRDSGILSDHNDSPSSST